MKKILSFAAVVEAFVACNGNSPEAPVVDYPQKDNAGVVEFPANKPQLKLGEKTFLVSRIDHFANGIYEGVGYEDIIATVGKRKSSVNTFIGRYEAKDGVYSYTSGEFKGGKLIKKADDKFDFSFGSESGSVSGSFTPATTPSNPAVSALCAAHWKLTYIEAKVKDKNVSVNFTDQSGINPNDVEKVAEYINKKGASIPMDKVEGYYIKAISLSETKVVVEFENGKPSIIGTWKPVLAAQTFSYVLDAELDGELFDAEGSGKFELANNNSTLILTMTAKNDSGLADIIIKAKKVN